MASIGANWAGVVVTLNHDETQELGNAEDASTSLLGILGTKVGALGLAVAVIGAYITVEKDLMLSVDKGNGVYLTLPWPAIFIGQYWLVIPTTRPLVAGTTGTITVRASDGGNFLPNKDWSYGPCFGLLGTYFADVTGDGKADCILVNPETITVRYSTGNDFGPSAKLANVDWSHGPCFGTRGTFFADVTGDGKADCILVNDDKIYVRPSTGNGFAANQPWTDGPCFGTRGTFFADVTGDRRADCILVNDDKIYVRPSTGNGFAGNQPWSAGPLYGNLRTVFADVTGDGKADCILVNGNTVSVALSNGSSLAPPVDWTHGPYYGNMGTVFADVAGTGKAAGIVVNG